MKQHNLRIPFSFMKTSLFLLLFISLIIFLFGIPLLCTILILKPQMPDFSLQTVHIQSYKLNVSSQNLLVSSVFSLNLIGTNPNKVGLSYDSSRFHVLSQGLVVGLIRIPQFHQPPLSNNVSIQTRALFECVNVSEIMYRNSRKEDSSKGVFGIRILGDVRAQVRIFNITLPKIKIALDCDVNVNQSKLSVSNQVYSMGWSHNQLGSTCINTHWIIQTIGGVRVIIANPWGDEISLPLNSQTVSKKCSLAILV